MDLTSIQPVLDWIAQNPNLAGLVVFLVAAGESLALVGIVVPGVVFMLGIGALVGLNAIDFWHAIIFAALGAIAGDAVSYWLGRHFDKQLRHVWPLSRYPQLIPKGEKFFNRHGGISVLFGRFVGPLRPIIPAVAGIMHMPQHKFYFINVLSAVLWAPVVILPGVAFGESIQLASEVFGKLIMLIVVLIVIGVLLGYLVKLAVSYTMMVSIETLADYFGLRNHEESIVSLGLMGVLAAAMIFFVYDYEIRYQPIATKQQAIDYQWWKDNWQKYSATHHKYQSDHPMTIQWWGRLDEIDQSLQQAGWSHASKFTMQNSLNFFLPIPESTRLPAMSVKLFNEKDALIMVAQTDQAQDYLVMRLWEANPNVVNNKTQLWVGTVYTVSVLSPLDLMHIPVPQSNYSQSVLQFANRLVSLGQVIRVSKKQYANIGVSEDWRGDVLLLEFANAQQDIVDGQHQLKLMRQHLGDSNVTIMSPAEFVRTQMSVKNNVSGQPVPKTTYQYQYNGSKMTIEHYQYETIAPDLDDARDGLYSRLQNMAQLQLVNLNEKHLQQGDLKGVQFDAQYQMMPFAKQVNYHVKLLAQGNNLWLATASYKDCDASGKQLVTTMLDSLSIKNP